MLATGDSARTVPQECKWSLVNTWTYAKVHQVLQLALSYGLAIRDLCYLIFEEKQGNFQTKFLLLPICFGGWLLLHALLGREKLPHFLHQLLSEASSFLKKNQEHCYSNHTLILTSVLTPSPLPYITLWSQQGKPLVQGLLVASFQLSHHFHLVITDLEILL